MLLDITYTLTDQYYTLYQLMQQWYQTNAKTLLNKL